MASRKKKRKQPHDVDAGTTPLPADSVAAGEWTAQRRPSWRRFPGPSHPGVPLRVAFDREPYAEVTAHAKESLDAEICGVLVGQTCEDDEGLFVQVTATIRGTAADTGPAHVTYTQETWNAIHREMEARYPRDSIVGWYHSHPGFGVIFSEMDEFIHRNFFSGETQIAVVIDPLGGDEAVAINGAGGFEYLDRFWVDGRERRSNVPARPGSEAEPGEAGGSLVPLETVQRLEARLAQLLTGLEEQRAAYQRIVLTTAVLIAVATVGLIGYTVYRQAFGRDEPPRLRGYVPVPVQVGDETVLLGVSVVDWIVPPSLNATYLRLEEARREREEERRRRAAADSAPPGDDQEVPP